MGTMHPATATSSPPPGTLPQGHIPVLDGLRGLAILAVLVFHFTGGHPVVATGFDLWASRVTGIGWAGVDLFFVLSGFLITGILYDSKAAPGYLRNFYARRVLRIFPLYYAALLVIFVVLPLVESPYRTDVETLSKYQGWLWLYCSNIGAFVEGDVFHSGLIQMDHFWSLAVEEQFYLVWPLVVLWLGRTALMRFCVGCIVAGLLLRIGMVVGEVPSIYTLTPCRLDGLMVGALVALKLRSGIQVSALVPLAKRVALTCVAVLGVIWASYGLDGSHWATQILGFPLLAFLFGAVLIVVLASPASSFWTRVFGHPALRFLGRYSYGIYVLHYLLMRTFSRYFSVRILNDEVFHHYWPSRIAYVVLASAISIVLAWFSWHLFEKHFVSLKRYFEPARPAPGARPTSTPEPAPSLTPAFDGGLRA